MLHLFAGGTGFVCLIVACPLTGRPFTRDRQRGWAAYSAITGFAFFAGFGAIASGPHAAMVTLGIAGSVVLAWAWIGLVGPLRADG